MNNYNSPSLSHSRENGFRSFPSVAYNVAMCKFRKFFLLYIFVTEFWECAHHTEYTIVNSLLYLTHLDLLGKKKPRNSLNDIDNKLMK